MKAAPLLAGLALGAVALYLAFVRDEDPPAPSSTSSTGTGLPPSSALEAVAPTAGAGLPGAILASLAGVSDYLGTPQGQAAAARAQGGLDALRRNYVRYTPVGAALEAVGVLRDPTEARREKRGDMIAAQTQLEGDARAAEAFMLRQWAALSRPDVERWVIGPTGSTHVRYRGASSDWVLPAPTGAETVGSSPLAWAYELVSRLFGAPVASGVGPVPAGLALPDDRIGFSEANVYAPRSQQEGPLTSSLLSLQGSVARSLRRPAPEVFRA